MVSHEQSRDLAFTKFPGGGLEPGEGPLECLAREFEEELGIHPEHCEPFYFTEVFIQSAFHKEDQLIALYFTVNSQQNPVKMQFEETRWGHPYKVQFQWIDIDQITPEIFKWPSDQAAVKQLKLSQQMK